ncbi:serine/threonine-protein kinase [Ancylobacter amanitiformis]|uniref:Serine/threonine protein kinase n=1 Tax=Ancylobacter amanitiformis TaxID=217069 RepID=A0ABU0LL78_9HYPH|nr:serine/threonine-protein kinase [Ancylobacter amanitiformis]MDQ0509456.1 serine/threonine protein kinase [Ancylobacter amanitiformis]
MSRAVPPHHVPGRVSRDAATPSLLPHYLGARLKDRYELIQVIGRGGMSTVYHAVDHIRLRGRASQPHVAVKVASMPPPYDHAAHELIHREAQRMQRLVHPNIVRVFDSDHQDDTHFLVMELLTGRTLATVLPEGAGKGLDWPQARRVVEGVAAALGHAHRNGVIHTDLKPGNVFIGGDGTVKVLDFGLAQSTGGGDAHQPDATIRYLDFVGGLTPSFASPERLAGAAPTPGCDLFAFGLLIYMVLCGAHPFQRRNAEEARKMGLQPLRPPGLALHRWRALRALMDFDPAARPASVDAFMTRFLAPRFGPRALLDVMRTGG